MTNPTKFPPQRGHAWRDDWQQRLTDLINARGFTSASQFAATRPTASLVELANDLGPGDVAAVQLQWRLLDEAATSHNVAACARDLLVRSLHMDLPEGWRKDWPFDPKDTKSPLARRASALARWESSIATRLTKYRDVVTHIGTALCEEQFPVGWLPANADDPILVEFFKHHWVEP
jgi:hypothetical protein